jgi:signal peptidase I
MLNPAYKMKLKDVKRIWGKIWYFIWEDNSIWSWIVNIILAFILIKFIVLPFIGIVFGTTHPIVAVVSPSMEHHEGFDEWWASNANYYSGYHITKQDFNSFIFRNGFKRGDIIILRGSQPENIMVGDVVVFRSPRPDPIIHRVIKVWKEGDEYLFRTKGDNNAESISTPGLDETRVSERQVIGKAWVRVPFLGYVKILFVDHACPLPLVKQTGQLLGICPKAV